MIDIGDRIVCIRKQGPPECRREWKFYQHAVVRALVFDRSRKVIRYIWAVNPDVPWIMLFEAADVFVSMGDAESACRARNGKVRPGLALRPESM